MAAPQASSRLEMLQARFQQKQLQEKEQKLLQLYDQQQQRAYQVVQRNSAGSGGSNHSSSMVKTTTTTHTTSTSQRGKVRQMFDERRHTKGIDRSYPLEPLENKLRKQTNMNGVATQRNGNLTTVNRQSVSMKRVARADVNSNVNGGKPVVSYHEEINRESFGPSVRRHDDEDEFGVENRVATYANGYYRHEADNEQEDTLNQETMERNRMMAKIHLMGFDESLKHRVRNDLESEEFPEYLMADVPDKLSKRNVTKKLSQAEARLERFKNANAKRSNMPKQSTPIGNVMKKRSEQTASTKASSRRSEIAGTSPTGVRSGSSRTTERSQRILENAKNPLSSRTRVVHQTSERRRESSDIETFSRDGSPRSFSRKATKADTAWGICPRSNGFKSVTSDGKIFVRRSASPQLFCTESERSAPTMSIDRYSDSSGSPLFYRGTLTKQRSPFFFNEFEQPRKTNGSKSPIWDRGISLRPTGSPQYLHQESKRSETALSTDRETTGSTKSSKWSKETKQSTTDFDGKLRTSTSLDRKTSSKSPLYEDEILKKRSSSPQFFCKESERSGTTMSIDHAVKEPTSSLYDREMLTKQRSPFFLNGSERYRRTSESKSPVWDREISSRQSTSSQYLHHDSKRSETALSTDRETIGSKSSEWSKKTADFDRKLRTSTSLDRKSSSKSPSYEEEILKKRSSSPQFFCKESERSATTMSIDHAFREPRSSSYDRETLTKRSKSPLFFSESEQYRKTNESKSPVWDKRFSSRQSTSSQYLQHDSKRSETTLSTDRETTGSKSSKRSKETLTKQKMVDLDRKLRSTSLDRKTSSKSPLYKEEILKKRSSSPQFVCKKFERSATTMSTGHAVKKPRSSSYDRETLTKRSESPRFFLGESEQYRITSESKSPIWDREISSRQSTSSQYLQHDSKRSETTLSTDRETTGSKSSKRNKETLTKQKMVDLDRKLRSTSLDRKTSSKSPIYKEEILKKRSSSPQFVCKKFERSATTMSTGHAVKKPRSSSYDRETLTKRRSPFYLNGSERYRKTPESKSPIRDRGISSRQSTSPHYFHHDSKRSETTLSTDRKTTGFKSSEWSKETLTKQKTADLGRQLRTSMTLDRKTSSSLPSYEEEILKKRSSSPQFFCKESERSATTMSIDHAFREPRSSYDRETLTKRSESPQFFLGESEQYRTTSESKSPIWDREMSSRQSTSPQYVHHESKRSETALSTDRKTTGSKSSEWSKKTADFGRKLRTSTSLDQKTLSKSPSYEEEILKKRSSSPQFFCKESERSGTTMSIDHTIKEPRSSSYDRETLTKPRSSFFLGESEKYRRTSESKSPIWDKEISSRQCTSSQYLQHDSKRSETALSTDRETTGSKLSKWSKEISTKQKADLDRKLRTSTSLDRKTSKSPSYEEEILKKRSSSPQFFCIESERSGTTMSIDHAVKEPRSSSYDRETLTKPSSFFLGESEQYHRTSESKSPIWDREVSSRQSTSSQYLQHDSKRSETALNTDRETTGSKSSKWSKEISTKQKMADFDRKLRTSTSLDRKTSSKSPSYEEEILKKRSSSPQFFCKESERSGTTMSIDHAFREPRSSSYDRETVTKRSESPRFFLGESEQYRITSESKSPIWDREISSRQSTSSQYLHHDSKRSETALSTDRETIGSKSSKWSKEISTKQKTADFDRKLRTSTSLDRRTSSKSPSYKEEILKKRSKSPQFFYKESERSGTIMSTDPVRKPRSSLYDRLTKRSTTPRLCRKTEQRSATTTGTDREYGRSKSFGATRDKRTTSPRFFCKESEKSATTMLIEPRSSSRDSKNILKQRNYASDVSYKRSTKSSPSINTKIHSIRDRYTPSSSITKHERRKSLKENEISATGTRRSSKISETSATSNSSIVSLKYGLEFDNIFQSAGLVRKFMKSHDGEQRKVHQSNLSSSKRNVKDVNYIVRDNKSMNRRKTSPLFQKARSPSIESRRRATPESLRKSLTPTEVDVEIQEITMTDHRIERNKLRKATTPISKRQINGTYTRSPGNKTKFKTTIAYPVRKTQRQRASVLESSVLKSKGDLFREVKGSKDHRSDRDDEGSAISLSKLDCSPASESSLQRIITRAEEDENRVSEAKISQTWNRSVKNQAESIAVQTGKREDRQRSTSRSPNQTRNRTAKGRAGGLKATSPDSFRGGKYSGSTISAISYNSKRRSKGTRAKFDQLQSLRSTHLVQGALRDKNLSADDVYNRGRSQDEDKSVAVDEVDAGIDIKYRTVVETALNEKIGEYRKITRRNSVDRIASKKVSPRETTRASMKSNISKRTISPTKDCGRQHDVKFRISPRGSPLRRTAEISRGADTKILSSQSVVSKADQSTKFFTYTVKDRKREGVLNAKKLTESSNKVNVKRKIEESVDAAEEFSRTRQESKKNFERMDSVESALKRFDSIGAEFEHSGPTSFRASSEISLQTMDAQANISTKEPIASEESTIISPREVTINTTLKSTPRSPVGKDLTVKNARKSDSKILGKQIRASSRPTKTGGSNENKRRSTQTRSPTCKRRLFESDWQKRIEESRPKSSYAKARKEETYSSASFRSRKDEAISKVRSSKDLDREVAMGRKRSEETPTFSVKALRSIEDIRKSIDNEQDALIATEESRSAIATRRSASRGVVDARGSISATDAARNVFLGDPARLTKVKSCVSRITKSPSPDSAARKQHETNARATRGSAPASPSKSPDVAPRRTSTEPKNQEAKPSRKSAIAKGADTIGNKAATTGTVDTVDGVVLQNGSLHEFTTKSSDAFVSDFDEGPSKEDDAVPPRRSSTKKSSVDKQQTASSASGRPTSSVSSNSSAGSTQGQVSSTKGKMTTKAKMSACFESLPKPRSTTSVDKLVPCKICKRHFAGDRIKYHEKICEKNVTTKKRKPFDSVMIRVRGTELEPFVKKNLSKKENSKTEKLQIKSKNWRRQHEDFINAIRSAKQVQAHLAAGGNLSDLPPPPPSDTSDYIQCPHCGRRFSPGAAERHIPKCQNMLHNKPAHSRAPRR